MPLDAHILSGGINPDSAIVTKEQALLTIDQPAPPPPGGAQVMRVFRQYMTDDGSSTGSNNLRVDGSATNVEFWIPASDTTDRYITSLSFVIADAGAAANEFGNGSALSNGCELEYFDENGPVTIHEGLKTNFDFVRLCSGEPAFGATTNAMRMSNVSGASEAFIPFLDLRKTFGFKWGIRLGMGTRQKIIMRIRDDCTAPDQFDIIAYGFDRS